MKQPGKKTLRQRQGEKRVKLLSLSLFLSLFVQSLVLPSFFPSVACRQGKKWKIYTGQLNWRRGKKCRGASGYKKKKNKEKRKEEQIDAASVSGKISFPRDFLGSLTNLLPFFTSYVNFFFYIALFSSCFFFFFVQHRRQRSYWRMRCTSFYSSR